MRYLEPFLLPDLKNKMILLSGPRQCGKTTFSKWILKEKMHGEYLNWDQLKDRKKIQNQDWDESANLIVFDEIHKKKSWKNFLKGIYDTKPDHLHLLVTGSARLEFFQKSGDSMFGRFLPWRMHPFCASEDPLDLPISERWDRLMNQGNFPVPYLAKDPAEIARWRNQRWTLLLREDLRDLENVKDIQALELMAELLKDYAAGMLAYANLAEDVEIAPKTIKRWVHILEKLYLIYLVTPYTGSLKRSISKMPKVYFMDSGDLVEQNIGQRTENLVMLNLLKRIHFLEDSSGQALELHYLRDKEGREVDFVITLKRKILALIEVKTGDQEPSPSLLYFKERLKINHAIQLHTDSKKKSVVKKGIKIISAQEFFASPVSTPQFWEW